ncbi:hypothetical protein EC957_008206 [Mortierella hygrophila]|uniref:Uncharacterized protein n=1 Tax=Mortierella hygrophila TaxID=979708 RepID=A0A9P6K8R3_9FUNG|nr:hypothetical protein EC957_008206 [Mortierella hygrophila]
MHVNNSKSNLDKKENQDPYSRDTKQARNKTTQQKPNVLVERNDNSAKRSTTKRQLSKDKESEGPTDRNVKRTKTTKPQQNDAPRYSNTRFQSATTKRLLDKDDLDEVERESKRNRTNDHGQTPVDPLNTSDASNYDHESVQSSSRSARVTARATAHKVTENSKASPYSRQTKRNILSSFRHASLDPWGRLDAHSPQVEMSFDIAPLDSALNAQSSPVSAATQSSPVSAATQQKSVHPENSEWTKLDNLSEWLAFEDEETSEPSKAVSLTVEEKQIVEKRNAEADEFVAKEKEKDILRAERIKIEEMSRIQHQQEKEEARRLEEEALRLQEEERAREEDAKKRELEKQRADRRKWWAEQEAKLQNPKSFDEAPLCHQQELMAEFEREMKEERQLQYHLSQQQRAAAAMTEFKLKMEGEHRIRYLHNQLQQAAAGTATHQHHQVRYLGNQQQQAAAGTATHQHRRVRYLRNQQQQAVAGTAAHQHRQFIPQRSKLNIRQDY